MTWRWARGQLQRRLKRKRAGWPHDDHPYEEVRERMIAVLKGQGVASLDVLEEVAVVATGIDRRVVSDALWLMIVSDLVYNRSGGFSVQFDGDKEEQDAS